MYTTKTEYFLKGNNMVQREIRDTIMGNARALLRLTPKETWNVAHNAGAVGWLDKDMKKISVTYDLIVGKDSSIVVAEIPTIPILSKFKKCADASNKDGWREQFSDKTIGPIWTIEPEGYDYILPKKYMYPWEEYSSIYNETMGKMILAFRFINKENTLKKAYLVAYHNKMFHTFKYPNQFDDGTMCLGDSFEPYESEYLDHPKDNLGDIVQDMFSLFLKTPCSNHLLDTFAATYQWSMEKDTCTFHHIPKNDTSRLCPVSNETLTVIYNELISKNT